MMVKTIDGEQLRRLKESVPLMIEEEQRAAREASATPWPLYPPPQPFTIRFSFRKEWRWYGFWRALRFWWTGEDDYRFIEGGFIGYKAERDRWRWTAK